MASFIATRMKQELDAIAKVYDDQFAGQSRGTRDLKLMDDLIRRTRNVLMQIDATPNASRDRELTDLKASAQEQSRMLDAERGAIQEARSAGPDFERFAPLAQRANFVMARYRRHFAGKNRSTRDIGLLDEMAEDMSVLHTEMTSIAARNPAPPFRRDLEAVTQALSMYRAEREEVLRSWKAGTPEEQTGSVATVANGQFELYADHFAGKGRSSRRPELLERMMRTLERCKTRMSDLSANEAVRQANVDNLAIVDGNLEMYATELEEIRKAKETTSIDDLVGALGGAANDVFDEYRKRYAGKDRKTVDRDRLGVMCDLLGEIERQMESIARGVENSVNTSNLEIVRSQLSSFEGEWDQVTQVQQPAAAR
jgi:hypothetical protein